ncbi:hypothetical protein B9K09_02835 [Pseudomonas sp. M30-35]|nr:hypothetical protein B9K09_02835 [Pseudomonas sp. M30-35]
MSFYGHNTLSIEGLGGLKTSRGLYLGIGLKRQLSSSRSVRKGCCSVLSAVLFPLRSVRSGFSA